MAENLEEKAPRVHEQFANDKAGYRKFLKWVKENSHGVDTLAVAFLRREHGRLQQGAVQLPLRQGVRQVA
ncbi:MAG: hypothetical protein L6U16_07670 [Porphyromonadaceae bacterium]|nr:MAG: hypothetical protein L6U16_07670 [Porphyromonadaceae bacterium]